MGSTGERGRIRGRGRIGWYRGYYSKIGDMPTWYGIIQILESCKAKEHLERPAVDNVELVPRQVPVKARY